MSKGKPLGLLSFSLLSVLIGVVAGLGAAAFRGLIAFFHNLLFLGTVSVTYDANLHTPPSPWGVFVILVPVLGALGVTFLVKNFAPEAKGHGVPEVIDAIYYAKGMIRPVVALIKSLASALSIGSGGSIGREGPIIQIGSSFGSTVGQILQVPVWQRITMIAAGAGGGIAATFNTPIGGVLFAVEIMMHEVSARTLVPVTISTATATYMGRIFFGAHPSFVIPGLEAPYFHLTKPFVLLSYVGLGILLGMFSALYIKSIYTFEDFFDRRIGESYTRHIVGMFLVGCMMYLLMIGFGHYYIEGIGYSTVQDVLCGSLSSYYLLLLLCVLKLIATSLTLGSGASGGIFSPALCMGVTLGGAYGLLLGQLFSGMEISPPAFAVAGMAGMVGGATAAALTAIVMIFEMTLDYNVIVPMTITVALSYGVRKLLCKESIYTMKLARRGHHMPQGLQAHLHLVRRAGEIMDKRVAILPASGTLEDFEQAACEQMAVLLFVIEDQGTVIGVVSRDAALEAPRQRRGTTTLAEIAIKDFVTVAEGATLFDVITTMRSHQAPVALVTQGGAPPSPDNIRGVISGFQLGDALTHAMELFTDS